MTGTVVQVATLKQWKAVLDVWFEQGHTWYSGDKEYHEEYFCSGDRKLLLNSNKILKTTSTNKPFIKYENFMAQQKEDNKMETYYVTQEQLDLIQELKSLPAPLVAIMNKKYGIETLYNELPLTDIEWFNYLSGGNKINFKVKDPLYQLYHINDADNKVYMRFNLGTPDWTLYEERAFTAPLEEIKKHKTVSWEIEEAK